MYQKIVYVADDGKEFETEEECFKYMASETFKEKELYKQVVFVDSFGQLIEMPEDFYEKLLRSSQDPSWFSWGRLFNNIDYIVFKTNDKESKKKLALKLADAFSACGLNFLNSEQICEDEVVYYWDDKYQKWRSATTQMLTCLDWIEELSNLYLDYDVDFLPGWKKRSVKILKKITDSLEKIS